MGYEIQVNGKTVWTAEESGEDINLDDFASYSGLDSTTEHLVTEISVQTPRGETTRLRIPPEEKILNLVIIPRSPELAPLDLVEETLRKAKRDEFEKGHTEEELSEYRASLESDSPEPDEDREIELDKDEERTVTF